MTSLCIYVSFILQVKRIFVALNNAFSVVLFEQMETTVLQMIQNEVHIQAKGFFVIDNGTFLKVMIIVRPLK